MNCEEYRQAITEDPSFDGGAGHLSECSACQAYRRDMLALNERIAAALAIDVPELHMPELPDVDVENIVTLESRRRVAPAWFAVAATVLVAVLLGVRLLGTGAVYDSLADEVVAHLDHEPGALVVTDRPVSDRRLNRVVPRNIADLSNSSNLITYARTCVINGKDVPHLVVQGERGPVTILLMPEETINSAVDLSGEHISGVLLPVGRGSIAIIGERGERIDTIKNNVVKSVTWET